MHGCNNFSRLVTALHSKSESVSFIVLTANSAWNLVTFLQSLILHFCLYRCWGTQCLQQNQPLLIFSAHLWQQVFALLIFRFPSTFCRKYEAAVLVTGGICQMPENAKVVVYWLKTTVNSTSSKLAIKASAAAIYKFWKGIVRAVAKEQKYCNSVSPDY